MIRRALASIRRRMGHGPAPAPTSAPPPARVRRPPGPISFADLSELPDPALIPPLDRPDLDTSGLTEAQATWRRDGALALRGFIPDEVLVPYVERRARLLEDDPALFLGGWRSPTPYEHVPEMRALALYPPLMRMMESLIGEPMMLHLALTGWVSTQRDWHQDDYLNPEFVNSWYAAVWIALDDIHPDSGPFEYVPGSHTWPLLRQARVLSCMTEEEEMATDPVSGARIWPALSERFVVPAIEAELQRVNAPVERFLAKKGDVLIWHGRLMHRGSRPRSPDLLRKALITHYSGEKHRPDMPSRARDINSMPYALFGQPLV